MDIEASFQNALDAVIAFVPRAIAFLAILLIGWIVARVLRKVTSKLLARVGLDRAAERGGLRRFTGKFTASELFGLVVYAAVMLFTLQLAFGAFGNNPVSTMINGIVAWLPQLFVAMIIMVVAFAIAKVVDELVSGTLASVSYGRTLATVARVAIIAIAAIAALNQIGVATTVTMPVLIAALATVAGIAIVGLGGGLIAPMRERWERVLGHAENEAANLKSAMQQTQQQPEFGQQPYASQQYDPGYQQQPTYQPEPHTGAQQQTVGGDPGAAPGMTQQGGTVYGHPQQPPPSQ